MSYFLFSKRLTQSPRTGSPDPHQYKHSHNYEVTLYKHSHPPTGTEGEEWYQRRVQIATTMFPGFTQTTEKAKGRSSKSIGFCPKCLSLQVQVSQWLSHRGLWAQVSPHGVSAVWRQRLFYSLCESSTGLRKYPQHLCLMLTSSNSRKQLAGTHTPVILGALFRNE